MSGLPVVHVPMKCVEVCPARISGRNLFVGKPRVSVVVLPRAASQDLSPANAAGQPLAPQAWSGLKAVRALASPQATNVANDRTGLPCRSFPFFGGNRDCLETKSKAIQAEIHWRPGG
ncbi:hypothetical protein [Arthrobacter livingstonensis]|uniref:hypothetical protein n=1 Tax=Arthrobacter livingstonensis TaxID=670078 RepID=UPI0011B43494|nr:hypothetical protein [Arthrobacter livingstonensis]